PPRRWRRGTRARKLSLKFSQRDGDVAGVYNKMAHRGQCCPVPLRVRLLVKSLPRNTELCQVLIADRLGLERRVSISALGCAVALLHTAMACRSIACSKTAMAALGNCFGGPQ